jgi:hypothetical protein
MRCVCLLGGLMAIVAGNLGAINVLTLSCSLNVIGSAGPFSGTGSVDGNGCFATSFGNITTLGALDWGAPAAGSGPSALGAATMLPPGSNGYALTATTPLANRTATVNNHQVGIQLAPGGADASVTRVDDMAMVWNGSSWVNPGFANVASFAGHFNSASSTSSAPGDHLLKDTTGTPLELTFLTEPAHGVWFRIASLAGTNSLFVAKVQGFDAGGHALGSYTLTEGGSYGSGGTCTSLSSYPPVPCNDAPYVGFYDPLGRISSIYVSVFDPGNLNVPIGFAIDSLFIEDAPEPAVPLMVGGGLAAIALFRRRRRSQVG